MLSPNQRWQQVAPSARPMPFEKRWAKVQPWMAAWWNDPAFISTGAGSRPLFSSSIFMAHLTDGPSVEPHGKDFTPAWW